MKAKHNSGFFLKKACLSLFLLLLFLIAPTNQKVQAWDAAPANGMLFSLEKIDRYIEGMLLASAKRVAIQSLNSQLDSLLGGSGGQGPRFITNWEDYLIKSPEREAARYMNDYLTQITSGRGNSSYRTVDSTSYIPGAFGFNNEGFKTKTLIEAVHAQEAEESISADTSAGESLAAVLKEAGQAGIDDPEAAKQDIQKRMEMAQGITEDNLFEGSNLQKYGVLTPWRMYSFIQAEQAAKKEEFQLIAEQESEVNEGFESTKSNGQVTMPGVMIKEYAANIQNMPIDTITNAQNLADVLVSTLVNKALTLAIQKGNAIVDQQINKSLGSTGRQIYNTLNQSVQNLGPGAAFNNPNAGNMPAPSIPGGLGNFGF